MKVFQKKLMSLLTSITKRNEPIQGMQTAPHPKDSSLTGVSWHAPTHYGKPETAPENFFSPSGPPKSPEAIRNAGTRFESVNAMDVERYYDETTGHYLEGLGEVFQGARPADTGQLLEYIADAAALAPGMRVLDAGCGVCGPALWFAARRDVSVEALSISMIQVEEAGVRIAEHGLEGRVHVTKGDFHRLAEIYPEESFDRVLFLESICHAEDYKQVLSQAMRVLKPGGYVYIKDYYCVDHRSRPHMIEQANADLDAMNKIYHLAMPDLPSTVNLISELGFRIDYMRHPLFESTREHMDRLEELVGKPWVSQTSLWPIQPVEFYLFKYPR